MDSVVELVRELERSVISSGRMGTCIELRLVTDSQVVKHVLEKGYSASVDLDQLMGELRVILDRTRIHIRAIWIPSQGNVADTPSRRILNRRCERCAGWQARDLDEDELCKCPRPVWEEDHGELHCRKLCPRRKEETLLALEALAA